MLYLNITLLLLTTTTCIFCVLIRSPRPLLDVPRDVLICAAHSDDCVITGAEYSQAALELGHSVTIVYLTCSASHPSEDIALTRKAEAVAAWSVLGVSEEKLTFIDLCESPVSGPPNYSDRDIAHARSIFEAAILSLPKNAALIVPADGESHVDHRTVRKIVLEAVVSSQRDDMLVYESPEYNTYLSLLHCPKRTLRTVLRHVPLLRQLIRPYEGPATYVDGSPGFVFRDTARRLAKKQDLLRFFCSQNADLLIHFFGYETPYRRLKLAEQLQKPKSWEKSRTHAFGCPCDLSVWALGITVLTIAFLTTYEVAKRSRFVATPLVPANEWLVILGGLLAIVYLARSVRRTVALETSLLVVAAASGLVLGAL